MSKSAESNSQSLTAGPEKPSRRELLRQIKSLRAELKNARRALENRDELLDALREAIDQVEPVNLPRARRSPGKNAHEVSSVLLFGDWHIGAVVRPDEVENTNEYNYRTACYRLASILEGFIRWSRNCGHDVRTCHVVCLGDLIDGLIHDELNIYAEFEPVIQVVRAANMLSTAVNKLSEHFDKVTVDSLATDNHSRMTRKPFYKGRGAWSLGRLVNELAMARLEPNRRVVFRSIDALKTTVDISGKKFLIEHGDSVRAYMGIPYYGLERLRGREAGHRMRSGASDFDYLVVGHWHTPAFIGNILINGALVGTTPYDHAVGRYSRPCQCAMLVHPRHGIFNWLPLFGDTK